MAVAYRSDVDIQQDVIDEIDWDPEVEITDVGVEVDDGVVTLTGTVEHYGTKTAAEGAAFRVAGVRAVANNIALHAAWADGRSDTDVAEAIANAFERNWSIPEEKIQIQVSNRRVTLKGEVDWHYQRNAALDTVGQTAGVRGVNSLITVRPDNASVQEVKDGIEQALLRSAEVDANKIRVQVNGSHVTLRGTVRSWAERKEAEEAAWKAPGVAAVTNNIVIHYCEARPT